MSPQYDQPQNSQPQYEPGYLRNGGVFVLRSRLKPCKFCGAAVESYCPRPICSKPECQARKASKAKAARKAYDAVRRAK